MFQPQHEIIIKGVKNYWLPYAIGCLWSYVKNNISGYNLGGLIFKRDSIDDVLKEIKNPDVCAFSTYIWNEQYNLKLAQEIKRKYPNCIIEFGGPQTTIKLVELDYVDCVILGEGERDFVDLLDRVQNSKPIQPVYERVQLE